jgi:hypothetical protein
MGQTKAEQETILRWDEEEQVVHVYSASPKTWRRCARLGLAVVKVDRYKGQDRGRFYRVPLAAFRWGLKARRQATGNAGPLAAAREARKASLRSATTVQDGDSGGENA